MFYSLIGSAKLGRVEPSVYIREANRATSAFVRLATLIKPLDDAGRYLLGGR